MNRFDRIFGIVSKAILVAFCAVICMIIRQSTQEGIDCDKRKPRTHFRIKLECVVEPGGVLECDQDHFR